MTTRIDKQISLNEAVTQRVVTEKHTLLVKGLTWKGSIIAKEVQNNFPSLHHLQALQEPITPMPGNANQSGWFLSWPLLCWTATEPHPTL